MLPAEEKIAVCRECRLPARLRDPHFLAVARRQGLDALKQHIIHELGKNILEQLGGDNHGLMEWIKGKLRFEEWQKKSAKNG